MMMRSKSQVAGAGGKISVVELESVGSVKVTGYFHNQLIG